MMSNTDIVEPGGSIGFSDIAGMLWRRRWRIVVPAVVGTAAAAVAAFVIPPVFESSSILLIESQQIPTSLVAAPFSSYVDERIAKIRQQILSRSNLLGMIGDYHLYADEQAKMPIEAVLEKMRSSIGVDLVSASAGNVQKSGASTTIAFNLSYRYADPNTAHRIASELTTMFVDADKRLRTEQASGAASFLETRAKELRDRLVEVENKRRALQARFAGALPDQAMLSAQTTASLRGEVTRIDTETQSIMQQNSLLAARTQDTIAMAEPPGRAEVRRSQQVLDRLTATLSDSHPDVIEAREALSAAKLAAKSEPAPRAGLGAIASEIQSGRTRIGALAQRRLQMVAAIAQSERILAESPQAAYELNNLERDQASLKEQYATISDKQLEAQVAANLQSEDKGERFSVVDAPTVPTQPVSPKRLQMILMGAVGGFGLGFIVVLAWELMAGCIHSSGAVLRLTGEAPLAIIPVFRRGPLPSTLPWFQRLLPWRQRVAA